VTHAEIIAKMDDFNIGLSNGFGDAKTLVHFVDALRAVVELHRPDKRPTWLPVEFQGYGCFNCGGNYPCATIKAIEKELQ